MTKIGARLVVALMTLILGVGVSSVRRRWNQNRLSTANEVGPRRTYARDMHLDAARGSLWLFSSSISKIGELLFFRHAIARIQP